MHDETLIRQVRALRVYSYCSSVAIALLVVAGFKTQTVPDVIRTRGIIVEDAEGRDRILIGAPAPKSKDRVRDDFEKVKKAWGERYGGKMDWFKTVNNETNGIIVLNEKGFDRIALGDPELDPNIGKRIDTGPGIVINDREGFERSGYSYFDRMERVVLGMDRPGGEATGLIVDKDGTAGLWFMGTAGEVGFAGTTPGKSYYNDKDTGFLGVVVQRGEKSVHRAGVAAAKVR